MANDDDIIIIRGYRSRVNYYGMFTVRAWVFIAAPIVTAFAGLVLGVLIS